MRELKRNFGVMFGGMGVVLILWLAFWGSVFYVAWHFISKWW